MPAQDFEVYRNPHQRLKGAYVLALAIVGFMTLGTHLLTVYVTSVQQENTQITHDMTRLRSLVYAVVSETANQKTQDADDKLLVELIKEVRAASSDIDADRDRAIYKIFHTPPYFLSQKLVSLLDEVNLSLRQGTTKKEKGENLMRIQDSSKEFYISLDAALESYHEVIMQQTRYFLRLQSTSAGIIIAVLFLEAFFIFRPLIGKVSKYHRDLKHMALTDTLTGLSNRRVFMTAIQSTLRQYDRHKKPFALVLADLDKFKSVNDTYGHHVGDAVLKHYSQLLQKGLRKQDVVSRIGGEEFAILLPETEPEYAYKLIEKIRKTVVATPCSHTDENGVSNELNYTSSFGVICVVSGRWTVDALFHEADQLLYRAKNNGRNCVVVDELRMVYTHLLFPA